LFNKTPKRSPVVASRAIEDISDTEDEPDRFSCGVCGFAKDNSRDACVACGM